MFLQRLSFLKSQSSSPSHGSHKQIGFLHIGGIFLVLLFIMATVATTPFNEQFDENDIPLLEMAMIFGMIWDFFSDTSKAGFGLGAGLAVVRSEHLRGHIGEKRFADGIVRANDLFILHVF